MCQIEIEGGVSFERLQNKIFMASGFAEGNSEVHYERLLEVSSHHVIKI